MHKVQPPRNNFLKIRRRLANNPVESPVSGGGQRNAFCAERERHDLMPAREQITRRQDERDSTSGGYNQGRGPQLVTSTSTPGLK